MSTGGTSTDALVGQNIDLVRIVARQVLREVGPAMTLDDLESAGREGLVTAAARFDESRGVPFRRFANYRVRGAMIDALRREAALPRRTYEKVRAMAAAAELNEQASEDATAPQAPGTTAATLEQKLQEHLANMATAIATGLIAETAWDEEEIVSVDPASSPEDVTSRKQLRAIVKDALAELTDQERALVEGHYFNGQRFDHVAAELGLSKSWASRIHTRAIARLTKRLGG